MITSCHNCVLHHGSCHLLSAYQRIYRMAERKCKARQMQLAMQEKDTDAARIAKYDECIQACAEHLGELPGSSTAEMPAVQDAQHRPYLFEGQMSSVRLLSLGPCL